MPNPDFPIVVQVSCEPDAVSGGGPQPWRGFEACLDTLPVARREISDALGVPIVLSWMLRADLHIEEVWGNTGWGIETYASQIEALVGEGDSLGLHCHPIRDRLNIEDYLDEQWTVDTVGAGIDAFEARFGHPPACVSWGRGWSTAPILQLLNERGVAVDMSTFPGRDQSVGAGSVEMLADVPDLATVPRHPYYPDADDWRTEADHPGDGTWILPFTTTYTDSWMTPKQQISRRVRWLLTRKNRYRRRVEQNYFFDLTQPGFPAYAETIAAGERPYLTFSIRASRLLATSTDEVVACFRQLGELHERYGATVTDPLTTVQRFAGVPEP